MSPEENKAIIRHYLETVWNQKDLSIIDTVIAPDLIQHVRNVPPGPDGIHRFFHMIYAAFPDAQSGRGRQGRVALYGARHASRTVPWHCTHRQEHRSDRHCADAHARRANGGELERNG